MNIDITRLKNSIETEINIDCTINFSNDYIKETEMLELYPVIIKGSISKTSMDDYMVSLTAEGKMVLPCALTLKPVDYPFSFKIEEIFSEDTEEIAKKIKKSENTIDILPIVWENILMEIPMKVVSPDASLEKIEGDGWKLVTEDYESTNPELAKLKDLLK